MHITEKEFGQGYRLITLENEAGFHLSATDLGARIVRLGKERELVLGFDSAEEYLTKDPYIGATVGRVAGRIENGHFSLGKMNYQVATDPLNGHCLHGGKPGFESKKWTYQIEETADTASIIFSTVSPDGEHGFPGNLTVEVRYTLTEENVWELTTRAISDQPTLFNPTNHVYFNLTGDVTQPIDHHQLWLNSSYYAPLRSDSIPTGEKVAVTNTAFDFQVAKTLDTVFSSNFDQKELFNGIDHPFFLDNSSLQERAARLTSPDGLITLEVFTDASSIVIFTANFGEDTPEMHGKTLADHGGITFETQTAPGAEQFPAFGSISLTADQPYETTTRFKIIMKEVD